MKCEVISGPFDILWLPDEKMWMNSWSEPVLQPTPMFPTAPWASDSLSANLKQPEGSPNLQQSSQATEREIQGEFWW